MTFQSFHAVSSKEKREYVQPSQPSKVAVIKGDGCCAYCGDTLLKNHLGTVDHIVPRSRGGSDHPENLLPCCKSCNTQKKDRGVEEFRVWVMINRRRIREGVPDFKLDQILWLAAHGFSVFSEMDRVVFHFEKDIQVWMPLHPEIINSAALNTEVAA